MKHVVLIGAAVAFVVAMRVVAYGASLATTLMWAVPLVTFVYFVLDPLQQFEDD